MEAEKTKSMYVPSTKEAKTLNHVFYRLNVMVSERGKKLPYFNDRSLLEFIDDSTKRWNGYIPPRDDLTDDWQARVFNNFTRNTVISFLSRIATSRPRAKFTATDKSNFEDTRRSHILEKFYEYSFNRENGDFKFIMSALECVVKGTVVVYEGYRKIKRKVREVEKFNPVDGEVSYKEKEILDFNDCWREVIPLEEFFVANVWESDMQMQPDVIWKKIVRFSAAKEEFSKYKNWSFVQAGSFSQLVEELPFFKNLKYHDLESDQVEITRYYNRLKDWYVISANGVVLYDGPIPFHHKRYPFAHAIYEPFAIDFFYGKSLPDKIATDQDVINTLWNMMLDQSYLSIFKPILNDDPDDDEETVLVPGLVKKVNNKDSFRVLNELTGPDNAHFNMLQFATRYAQDNAGGVLGGGVSQSPRGGKVSARQALMAEEQTRAVLGLSGKLLEKLELEAAYLRIPNILQFWTVADKADKVAGERGALKNFMRVIRLDETTLSDGSKGTSIVRIAKDEQSLPQQHEVEVEEETAALQGRNVEILAVTPDYIRNVIFDVQIVPESSYQQSKSISQGLAVEFYQMLATNPLINQEANTRELIESYDKDPDKLIKGQATMPGAAPGVIPIPGASQGEGEAPPMSAQMSTTNIAGGMQNALGG